MDPLSLAASIIAVISVATKVADVLAQIREDWNALPGRVHALNNEIQDFTIVLQQVSIAIEERRLSGRESHGESTFPLLLTRGELALLALEPILQKVLVAGINKRDVISRVLVWRREQGRIALVQNDIKQVKSSLNILLGASNFRDMMHLRLQLETLSLKFSDTFESGAARDEIPSSFVQTLLEHHQATIVESMSRSYAQVDERLEKVEALLHSQTSEMQNSQKLQIGSLYSATAPPARRREVRPLSPLSANRIQTGSASVGIRLRQACGTCQTTCPCSCHSLQSKKTPSFMDRMLGQVFVGYSGLPLLSTKCDSTACVKQQVPMVNVEYWFPLGFCWSQIVRLHLSYEANAGPSLQISTLRRVSDASPCVSFAVNGNLDGLKSLFSKGLASPRDVSSTRGYSLLRWALYGQQYETCKFLMAAGADPTYRPIAQSDDCPRDKAGDILLRGGIPQEVVDVLRLMSEGGDYTERQNFARIHKIVLGLCSGDLEEEIRRRPRDIDLADATGRTALQWAAARGDERAVITLLSWGADPNNMDAKLNTPLTLAANQNQTLCVRLLLEAGALPDPELPPGVKFGTPLNCAARNASDPMLMKTLLDFNANIEASGVDGVTPLIHVARGNSAAHAVLLLEYGAAINATSISGQTPLTAAIQFGNHAVLKLLLERWSEYNECPRLKGPNLLEVVSRYADVETMLLLTAAEHLRARPDSAYVLNHYRQLLDARDDASDKLNAAFEDLLSVLRVGVDMHGDLSSLMESGLYNPFTRKGESDKDTDEDCIFEDAKESLDIANEHNNSACCPAARLIKRFTI